MNSITIERNGKNITISNERERDLLLSEIIGEKMKAGLTFADAWGIVESAHPQIFAGMRHPHIKMPAKPKLPTIANAATTPVFGPQWKKIFRLPIDATQEEGETVWRANGDTGTVLNFPKCFDALVQLIQRQRQLEPEAARSQAEIRFPELWEVVQTVTS
jgi:hypothetical protein